MASVEYLEQCKVKLTFEVSPERFAEGINAAYQKNRNQINISGFRKGKAPRLVIEKTYGADIFFQDAAEYVFPNAYMQVLEENKLEPVSEPSVTIEEISKEKGILFSVICEVLGDVSIDGYYGLTYRKVDTSPDEEEIQLAIDRDRDRNARIVTVDRPVKDGDLVVIDFTGYIDGQPFDGGHADNFELTIGSASFIDTFENQLLESKTGDHVTVYVNFPEEYHAEDLKGKPATFEVDIKDVREKELPEADDDFAQDISDFDTFQEYHDDIADKIKKQKERDAVNSKHEQIFKQLMEKTEVNIPRAMIDAQAKVIHEEFERSLQQQGMNLQNFMEFAKMSPQALAEEHQQAAVQRVKGKLALLEVAKRENLSIEPEDLNSEIRRLTEAYHLEDGGEYRINADLLEKDMRAQKAMAFILDKAIEIQ